MIVELDAHLFQTDGMARPVLRLTQPSGNRAWYHFGATGWKVVTPEEDVTLDALFEKEQQDESP